MAESLRIFGLLLYKNYLVRKRQWIASLIGEVLVPVGLMLSIWVIRDYVAAEPTFVNDQIYDNQSLEFEAQSYHPMQLYYAPNNTFINTFMGDVKACFKEKTLIQGFASEEDLLRQIKTDNASIPPTVLVFDDKDMSASTKNLGYKIRSKDLKELEPFAPNQFYYQIYYWYFQENQFLPLQYCVDTRFIKQKAELSEIPDIYIQRVPDPGHISYDLGDTYYRTIFTSLIVVAFLLPLIIETSRASSEKFLGVNVLMSMNGVSNSLNLFSWIFSGWIFLGILCIIPMILLMTNSAQNAIPYLNYGNPLIIWIVLNFNLVHLLAFGVHVSAHFSRSLLVMFGILIVNVGSMVLQLYGINEETMYIMPYLGILFPNLLMYRTFDELNYYEKIKEGNNWSNLFVVGDTNYGTGGSIGMSLILSIVGFVFHYVMAIYVYAIKPGKYGVKKSPLFFLKTKSKSNSASELENMQYDEVSERLFESMPRGVYTPGIQMRNLQKTFKIGVLNKSKVHALRGVSIDFYKGQITSLLGHNGAGKTTMMSILTGMISPTDGLVLVDSKDIKEKSSDIMHSMGLCTQENMVFPYLTVMQQLEFFAKLKGKGKSSSEIKQNIKIFLEKLRMYEKRNSLPQHLSGGQKRRLCLGMALVGDPSILILDEPTSGLDPESRRVIWDILLKLRGYKTILISTHDMEEADILGDRIAILHGGQLKSYGTSMFLKKIIGQGNVEVTLSTEPACDPERIRQELDSEGTIMNEDGNKLVISIPKSPDLPDSLDSLERRKKELGISGLSVSIISLEQVFLKVTQENDHRTRSNHAFTNTKQKVTGSSLYLQGIRALFSKKMTYTLKNLSTIAIMLFNIILGLICISFILKSTTNADKPLRRVDISLDMYNQPETMYKSDNKEFGEKYKVVTNGFNGKANEAQETNIIEALLKYGKKGLSYYDSHLIAAAELNSTGKGLVANALYSEKAIYSLPISFNLLMNSLLKFFVGDEYSISVSSQQLPISDSYSYSDSMMEIINSIFFAVVFVFTFYPAIALFVIHPLRESSMDIKQLQQMSGASCLSYWGTMFLFDLVVYMLMVALILVGFICIDSFLALQIYGALEIRILVLSFILFAINALPIVYIFSFAKTSTSATVRLLTYIPIGLVIIEIIMYLVKFLLSMYNSVNILRKIQKGVFLLIPYVSFLHTQVSVHQTALRNARCEKLPNSFYNTRCSLSRDECCRMECYDGECKKKIEYFTNFDGDVTLEESLVYMVITPIIYFGILIVLENQLIQKLLSNMTKHEVLETPTDEQVNKEKSLVAQRISVLEGSDINTMIDKTITIKTENGKSSNYIKQDNPVFLVYELRKQYGKLLAVKDVSFRVKQRECFGLLGVNGAGKSTTFRMMTGGEVPDHGMMYINDKDITKDRAYFLSQMGYCPQNDAIIKSLNAYDHLRLFARLRGVAENGIEEEVQSWIERLNLIACANQPSGTYSGGNKRRLNIAIALIGNPNLVLMDEPTTGVDPGARRSLWNVIQACQKSGQAVILTSHSMEECEALCNRLAIMVGGKFVCIGPSQELKQRFGAGYDIQIKMNPEKAKEQIDDVKTEISQRLNCVIVDENLGYLMYHVKPNEVTWRRMYDVMNGMKDRFDCIDDYSVLSSTLEQLFLLFARAANNDTKISVESNT